MKGLSGGQCRSQSRVCHEMYQFDMSINKNTILYASWSDQRLTDQDLNLPLAYISMATMVQAVQWQMCCNYRHVSGTGMKYNNDGLGCSAALALVTICCRAQFRSKVHKFVLYVNQKNSLDLKERDSKIPYYFELYKLSNDFYSLMNGKDKKNK